MAYSDATGLARTKQTSGGRVEIFREFGLRFSATRKGGWSRRHGTHDNVLVHCAVRLDQSSYIRIPYSSQMHTVSMSRNVIPIVPMRPTRTEKRVPYLCHRAP